MRISAVLAALLVGCPKPAAQVPDGGPPVTPHVVAEGHVTEMHDRLTHVTRARDLLVKGSMDGARAELKWVADNVKPASAPPEFVPYLQELREIAATAAETMDTAGLAEVIADTGRACGSCHAQVGEGPRFEAVSVPPPEAQMARHTWAADRMWEGLVAADADRWRSAAEVLEGEFVDGSKLYAGVSLETAGLAARLHERVHALGEMGQHSGEAQDRAELYGAYIAACAECHALLGRGPE